MSEILVVNSSSKKYVVSLLASVNELVSRVADCDCIIADEKVVGIYPSIFVSPTISVAATEENKSFANVEMIIEKMRKFGLTRTSRVAVIGGGVVQDVSTLALSLFMRGVDWVLVPTTVLSMVDSCIGGKSSINVGNYKNLAGNFFPPSEIILWTGFSGTLSTEQMIEGIIEGLKICFADKQVSFLELSNQANSLVFGGSDTVILDQFVVDCLKSKKRFIEEDEFDKGIRLLLNAGHTFGHALEAASEFRIRHGIAVGFGILMAIEMSRQLNVCATNNLRVEKLEQTLSAFIEKVVNGSDLIRHLNVEIFMNSFKADKKHSVDQFVIIGVNSTGHFELMRLRRTKKIEANVAEVLKKVCSQYEI